MQSCVQSWGLSDWCLVAVAAASDSLRGGDRNQCPRICNGYEPGYFCTQTGRRGPQTSQWCTQLPSRMGATRCGRRTSSRVHTRRLTVWRRPRLTAVKWSWGITTLVVLTRLSTAGVVHADDLEAVLQLRRVILFPARSTKLHYCCFTNKPIPDGGPRIAAACPHIFVIDS
jgi:hypothetical protein